MLSKYDNVQNKAKEVAQIQQSKRQAFVDDFEIFANSVIKPMMTEIGNIIKEKGHDYKVSFDKEYANDKGNVIDSRITMNIFPNGKGRGDHQNISAHILFYADKYSEKIGIHENNIVPFSSGTSCKKSGDFTIQSLTPQIIEKEIIDSIGNILKIK